VIPKFIDSFFRNENVIINGDGSHSRDFTHIDNVVFANLLAMATDDTDSLNNFYNVGCGEKFSLVDLIKEIQFNLKIHSFVSNSEICFGAEKKGDVKSSLASISKIEAKLKFKVIKNFKEGIKDLISTKLKK
jgi:nucleoside-diphosphate-sugar epimerase